MENVADIYPLSPAQEGMLFHTLAEPGSGVYVEQLTATLRGDLDAAAYREAWERVVARHPVLRTSFLWDGLEQPVQVVRRTVELPWAHLDWSGLPDAEQARQLEALLEEDRARGFELAAAPPMRVRLIRTGPDAHQLVWTFHHILLDGWSTPLVLGEVQAEAAALRRGAPASPVQRRPFRDYIAWLQGQDLSAAEAFWRAELAGLDAPTPLPLEPGPPGRYDQQEVALSEAATDALRSFARQHRLTLNSVLQGAWAAVLSRMSGEDDVVYGTTVAGRPAALPGVEAMIGAFINTLPMRVSVDADAPVAAWLRSVQDRALAVREHEHTPLARIQQWSGVRGGRSLFDSLLVFENYPLDDRQPDGGGVTVEGLEYREQSNYPLALLVVPGAGLRLIAVHDTARFDARSAGRLLGHVATLLEAFVASPDAPLGSLSMLPDAERAHLLELAEGPALPPHPGTVLGWIEAHVRDTPDAPAVTFEGEALTYAQLWRAAGALAAELQAQGVGAGVPVGLCAERSRQLVVGIVGILRAGGAYVPVDPGYPEARIRATLADAAAPVLVTHGRHLRTFADAGAALVDLDAPRAGGSLELATPGPDDLAYVLYTSGSTGRPKGVAVTHANLAASTAARLAVYDAPVERFLLLSSVAFDSSVAGLFWTLATGGTLVIPPDRIEQDVDALASLLARERVTHTLCLPSLYRVLLDLVRPDALASLECVIAAGEALPPDVAALHRARARGAALTNEYGPTEATVWATAHRVPAEGSSARVPIGRPIPGARVYVLDAHDRLAPLGVPGELVIGGAGVARGYLGRPDRTAAAFVPDPFASGPPARCYRTGDRARWLPDGALDILGRADDQVKIRGYRVELGEVEAVVQQHPSVREAAVAVEAGPELAGAVRAASRLTAYVEPSGAAVVDAEAVRAFARDRLPSYMVPGAVVVMDALPRTPNGKVDRRALPAPGRQLEGETAAPGPRTPVERQLAAIWADVLRVDAVGVDDDFFEMGGDSISSIQIIARANRAGLQIKPRQFFDHPTIAALARVAVPARPAPPAVATSGPVPLTPIQRWFFELAIPDRAHWTQSLSVALDPGTDLDALEAALRAAVQVHDAFRLRFQGRSQQLVGGGGPVIAVHRHTPAPGEPRESARAQIGATSHESLELATGPLIRADLVAGAEPYLVLTAHHLVVDVLSWPILLEDVEAAYARRVQGDAPALRASGTPFSRWAEALTRYAASDALAAEAEMWQEQAARPSAPLPTDADGPNTERTAHTHVQQLDAGETQALAGATEAYGMKVPEIVLTALACALSEATGAGLRVDFEGHGRVDLDGLPDVSRTVGWLTTTHPLTLGPVSADRPREALIHVKEAVRGVPHAGIGYGVLRHLGGDPPPDAEPADVLFNFLGHATPRFAPGSPFRAPVELGGSRDPDGARGHLVEINALVVEGRLTLRWTYSTARHHPETLASWVRRTHTALQALVRHCLSSGAGAYTPSDFPDVDLDQDGLDALLGEFDEP